MAYDRITRKIQNSKEESVASGNTKSSVNHSPSVNSMKEGEQIYAQEINKPIALYKKHKGKLYKLYFSDNGNLIVDGNLNIGKNLIVNKNIIGTTLKIIPHNMQADINTAETFLPWFGIKQATDLTGVSSSFLTPYPMTLNKIMFRAPTIGANSTADLAIKLYKMDDGDAVVDIVARATHQDELVANTFFVVNKSDFDAHPKFEMGDNCGISIEAVSDYGSSINWKITSVWEVETQI